MRRGADLSYAYSNSGKSDPNSGPEEPSLWLGLKMIDEDQMNAQMAALAEKVRYDPGYHTGLKIFAHSQEFVAPVWSA